MTPDHDSRRGFEQRARGLAETLAWLRATPDAVVTGLSAAEEEGVLRLTRAD